MRTGAAISGDGGYNPTHAGAATPCDGGCNPQRVLGVAGALRFMPTGGVTRANMDSYLALPCVLCVGGSWLVPQDALKARDFARITQIAADAVLGTGTAFAHLELH